MPILTPHETDQALKIVALTGDDLEQVSSIRDDPSIDQSFDAEFCAIGIGGSDVCEATSMTSGPTNDEVEAKNSSDALSSNTISQGNGLAAERCLNTSKERDYAVKMAGPTDDAAEDCRDDSPIHKFSKQPLQIGDTSTVGIPSYTAPKLCAVCTVTQPKYRCPRCTLP